MINRILLVTLLATSLTGCSAKLTSLENASISYKQHKDYESLEAIYNTLARGMPRKDIERLLGESDYSPIDGQHYYSSDRKEYSEAQQRDVTVGVVVDYRDSSSTITESLHEFWLGPIDE